MFTKRLLAALLLLPSVAFGQSNPGWEQRQVPTANQWNAQFGSKWDYNGGTLTNPAITGGSLNNAPIGATTANTGKFTTLGASGATALQGALTLGAGSTGGQAITASGTGNFNVQLGGSASLFQLLGGGTGHPAVFQVDSGGPTFISKQHMKIQTQGTDSPVWSGASIQGMVPIFSSPAWTGTSTVSGDVTSLFMRVSATTGVSSPSFPQNLVQLNLTTAAGVNGPVGGLGIKLTQAATNTGSGGAGGGGYVPLASYMVMTANDGGVSGTPAGAGTALNLVANWKSGATFVGGGSGTEIDIGAESGSSLTGKIGAQITLLSTDAVQGSTQDAAFMWDSQSASVPGWKTLLQVGSSQGYRPMDPTNGTILSFFPHGGSGTIAGKGGFDFTNFVPTTFFMKANNYLLDPSGNELALSYQTTPATVASLPACNTAAKGIMRSVSDANSTTYNATAAGSGSNIMPVFCNGTNWTLH